MQVEEGDARGCSGHLFATGWDIHVYSKYNDITIDNDLILVIIVI